MNIGFLIIARLKSKRLPLKVIRYIKDKKVIDFQGTFDEYLASCEEKKA